MICNRTLREMYLIYNLLYIYINQLHHLSQTNQIFVLQYYEFLVRRFYRLSDNEKSKN